VVEFIPFMLIILGWHPDRPGEISLERPEILFASIEMCQATGEKMAADRTKSLSEKSGALYEFRCLPIPSSHELEDSFEQLKTRTP